ncbi:MAG: hypothetical protein AMXMBFR47_30270 [Planctomycetota bacterium]
MRNLGEILASFGTFMLLSGLRLGFTKYQLDREQDLSMFLGGVGFSLLVVAVGFSLIRKAKAAERREALETDRPRRRRIRVLPWYIGVPVAILASLLLPMLRGHGGPSALLGTPKVIENEEVSFSGPKTWIACPPDRSTVVGFFISADSTVAVQKAMITVEIGHTAYPDLSTAGRRLADLWGGSVADDHCDLAGTPAMRIRAEHLGRGMQPIDAFAALRGERIYLIMGGTLEPGFDIAGPLDEIRASWRWKSQ